MEKVKYYLLIITYRGKEKRYKNFKEEEFQMKQVLVHLIGHSIGLIIKWKLIRSLQLGYKIILNYLKREYSRKKKVREIVILKCKRIVKKSYNLKEKNLFKDNKKIKRFVRSFGKNRLN